MSETKQNGGESRSKQESANRRIEAARDELNEKQSEASPPRAQGNGSSVSGSGTAPPSI
jgi:hypothetical protein